MFVIVHVLGGPSFRLEVGAGGQSVRWLSLTVAQVAGRMERRLGRGSAPRHRGTAAATLDTSMTVARSARAAAAIGDLAGAIGAHPAGADSPFSPSDRVRDVLSSGDEVFVRLPGRPVGLAASAVAEPDLEGLSLAGGQLRLDPSGLTAIEGDGRLARTAFHDAAFHNPATAGSMVRRARRIASRAAAGIIASSAAASTADRPGAFSGMTGSGAGADAEAEAAVRAALSPGAAWAASAASGLLRASRGDRTALGRAGADMLRSDLAGLAAAGGGGRSGRDGLGDGIAQVGSALRRARGQRAGPSAARRAAESAVPSLGRAGAGAAADTAASLGLRLPTRTGRDAPGFFERRGAPRLTSVLALHRRVERAGAAARAGAESLAGAAAWAGKAAPHARLPPAVYEEALRLGLAVAPGAGGLVIGSRGDAGRLLGAAAVVGAPSGSGGRGAGFGGDAAGAPRGGLTGADRASAAVGALASGAVAWLAEAREAFEADWGRLAGTAWLLVSEAEAVSREQTRSCARIRTAWLRAAQAAKAAEDDAKAAAPVPRGPAASPRSDASSDDGSAEPAGAERKDPGPGPARAPPPRPLSAAAFTPATMHLARVSGRFESPLVGLAAGTAALRSLMWRHYPALFDSFHMYADRLDSGEGVPAVASAEAAEAGRREGGASSPRGRRRLAGRGGSPGSAGAAADDDDDVGSLSDGEGLGDADAGEASDAASLATAGLAEPGEETVSRETAEAILVDLCGALPGALAARPGDAASADGSDAPSLSASAYAAASAQVTRQVSDAVSFCLAAQRYSRRDAAAAAASRGGLTAPRSAAPLLDLAAGAAADAGGAGSPRAGRRAERAAAPAGHGGGGAGGVSDALAGLGCADASSVLGLGAEGAAVAALWTAGPGAARRGGAAVSADAAARQVLERRSRAAAARDAAQRATRITRAVFLDAAWVAMSSAGAEEALAPAWAVDDAAGRAACDDAARAVEVCEPWAHSSAPDAAGAAAIAALLRADGDLARKVEPLGPEADPCAVGFASAPPFLASPAVPWAAPRPAGPGSLVIGASADRLARVRVDVAGLLLGRRWQPAVSRLLGGQGDAVRAMVAGESAGGGPGTALAATLARALPRLRATYLALCSVVQSSGGLGGGGDAAARRADARRRRADGDGGSGAAGAGAAAPPESPGEGVSWQGVTVARLAQLAVEVGLMDVRALSGGRAEPSGAGFDAASPYDDDRRPRSVTLDDVTWSAVQSLATVVAGSGGRALPERPAPGVAAGSAAGAKAQREWEGAVRDALILAFDGTPVGEAPPRRAGAVSRASMASRRRNRGEASGGVPPARRDVLDFWGFVEAVVRLGVVRWAGADGVSDAEAAARALDAVTVPKPPAALPPPPRLSPGAAGVFPRA